MKDAQNFPLARLPTLADDSVYSITYGIIIKSHNQSGPDNFYYRDLRFTRRPRRRKDACAREPLLCSANGVRHVRELSLWQATITWAKLSTVRLNRERYTRANGITSFCARIHTYTRYIHTRRPYPPCVTLAFYYTGLPECFLRDSTWTFWNASNLENNGIKKVTTRSLVILVRLLDCFSLPSPSLSLFLSRRPSRRYVIRTQLIYLILCVGEPLPIGPTHPR